MGPELEAIRGARRILGDRVRRTPTLEVDLGPLAAAHTRTVAKLELFQHTGSFKARGALLNTDALDAAARARGVTAVSAGNHALALAWAARQVGTSAKIVMPRSANPFRVARCRDLEAEVILVADVHAAFAEVERIEREEGRTFVHPFDGPKTVLGTATVGLELLEDAPRLDAVIVPIGGGGLAAGVATAVKRLAPACQVFGVEPEGADSMSRSFAAGAPRAIDRVATIADSLGAPRAEQATYEICRAYIDDIVRVDDDALCSALALLQRDAKLAVEPAGAAATAALLGPLRERLAGRTVGLVICGANLDAATYATYLARGAAGS
jgi:threonine dehydratase